jgi:hypothetical protein
MKSAKSLLILVVAIIVGIYFFKGKPAVRYNDKIVSHQRKVYKKLERTVNSLKEYLSGNSAERVEKQYEDLKEQAKESLEVVRNMPDFKGNTAFRDEAVQLFQFYLDITENELRELIDLLRQSSGARSGGSFQTQVADLADRIISRGEELLYNVQIVQKEFAEEFDFKVK